jgi:hypothetical protein
MTAYIRMVIKRSPIAFNAVRFDAMSQRDQYVILLGQRIGDPVAEIGKDRNFTVMLNFNRIGRASELAGSSGHTMV